MQERYPFHARNCIVTDLDLGKLFRWHRWRSMCRGPSSVTVKVRLGARGRPSNSKAYGNHHLLLYTAWSNKNKKSGHFETHMSDYIPQTETIQSSKQDLKISCTHLFCIWLNPTSPPRMHPLLNYSGPLSANTKIFHLKRKCPSHYLKHDSILMQPYRKIPPRNNFYFDFSRHLVWLITFSESINKSITNVSHFSLLNAQHYHKSPQTMEHSYKQFLQAPYNNIFF